MPKPAPNIVQRGILTGMSMENSIWAFHIGFSFGRITGLKGTSRAYLVYSHPHPLHFAPEENRSSKGSGAELKLHC